MSVIQFVFLVSMLESATVPPSAVVIPPGTPLTLKQAERQGLHRLSTAELRQFVPGILERPAARRQRAVSDGRASLRIDETTHTYCNIFTRKRNGEESCFAVFRAADGVRHFGYDIKRGGYPHIWLRSPGG
jgi:hypothetical protein